VNVLFDGGSQKSYVTEKLRKKLELKTSRIRGKRHGPRREIEK